MNPRFSVLQDRASAVSSGSRSSALPAQHIHPVTTRTAVRYQDDSSGLRLRDDRAMQPLARNQNEGR